MQFPEDLSLYITLFLPKRQCWFRAGSYPKRKLRSGGKKADESVVRMVRSLSQWFVGLCGDFLYRNIVNGTGDKIS